MSVNKLINQQVYEDENGIVRIGQQARHLRVANGDIVMIKRFAGLTTDAVDWFSKRLWAIGLTDCIVVVVDRLSDIRTLNEEQMRNNGWVRANE